jgi:ABC-type dipeptide/oligopeptide/nickel transport system ATPase component
MGPMMAVATTFQLDVTSLSVHFKGGGSVPVLKDLTFSMGQGEIIGILGESGSGKSTLALSLLGLVADKGGTVSGSVTVNGSDILKMPVRQLRSLRGRTLSLVFQEPGLSLNPIMRVGKQVAEVIRAHHSWPWDTCVAEAKAVMSEFFRDDLDRIFTAFPHQLSGGQRQRVLIAQAVANQPHLLIADEPTASLDANIQFEVLMMLRTFVREHAMSLIIISHDPRVVRLLADRVFVMQEGRIIEEGPVATVFAHPTHPYTRTLLRLSGVGAESFSLPGPDGN